MVKDGAMELCEDDLTGDPAVRRDPEGQPGVVVEPREDLDVLVSSEAVMGEVGLPGLVRHLCDESDIGGAGPFLRLGDDEAGPGEIARDRGGRDRHAAVVLEVPSDRVRSGVETTLDELTTEPQDVFDHLWRSRRRRGERPSRPRLERPLALGPVTGDELGDPPRRDPVGTGDLGLRPAL